MPVQPISVDSVEALAAASGTTIIYKHSSTCSLCWVSAREMAKLSTEDGVTVHQLDVFGQRALSNAIEEHFGVRHESPQVLILEEGQLAWHASHRAVTAERVRAALAGRRGGAGARV